jgi:hypothetical protein
VAGSAKTVTDNHSMVKLSAAERFGAVLGYVESRENITGNYYMTLEEDPGAIDGISYDGCAQAMGVEAFLAIEGLDSAFRHVVLTFVFDDGSRKTLSLDPGESLKESQIPEIPAREGCTAKWEGLTDMNVTFDQVYKAVYASYTTVLASAQLHKDGRPLVLCEGTFGPGETVELTDASAPQVGKRQTVSETVGIQLPQSGSPVTLRLLPQREAVVSAVLVQSSNGRWQEVTFRQVGSYLVVDVAEDTCAVALVEETPFAWHLIAIPFGVAALVVIVAVVIRKRKQRRGRVA